MLIIVTIFGLINQTYEVYFALMTHEANNLVLILFWGGTANQCDASIEVIPPQAVHEALDGGERAFVENEIATEDVDYMKSQGVTWFAAEVGRRIRTFAHGLHFWLDKNLTLKTKDWK